MSTPTVSVCLPTYNYARFLPRAVESVLAQSYRDFELLVFDDASTDDTVAVMQPYLDDPRVTFVVQEQNQGLFANFNQSAQRAQGKYVKYLCADDWLHEEFLADTVALLANDPSLSLATTANWLVDIDDRVTGEQVGPFGVGPRVAAADAAKALADWGNVIGMPTNTLIRRQALVDVGYYDAEYAPASDVHLWLKLLSRGDLGWTPERRCFIRIHNAHSHTYGPDPTESIFLIWGDAADLDNSPVSQQLAVSAIRQESTRVQLYMAAHLLRGDLATVRRLSALMRNHISRGSAVFAFLKVLPRFTIDQVRRLTAIKRGRMVRYLPRPRGGEKLQ